MFDVDRTVAVVDTTRSGPEPPNITKKDIWAQFKIDIMGKEVQTAETYSHSWIANQFGHVCLGIVLASLLGVALGGGLSVVCSWLRLPSSWHLPALWDHVVGSVLVAIGVAWWEWRAYRNAVRNATGQFPTDRKLLRDNAVIAAAYMILGVAIAFVHRYFALTSGEWLGVPNVVWGALCFLGLVIIAIRLAVPWLRQKIVWQKAGLPYLFRLADTRPTMAGDDVKDLQRLIDGNPPPQTEPCPIVIGGPIGSGRTEFSAAIGTEFAFRQATVRYLSFGTLLEFAARSQNQRNFFDDIGPANIGYWPWAKAQVVIIDDIGPLLTTQARTHNHRIDQFRQVLNTQLMTIQPVLAQCHTVWVIGDPRGEGQMTTGVEPLDEFAYEIRNFCTPRGKIQAPEVVVAQLAGEGIPEAEKTPMAQRIPKTPRITKIRRLR
jgi:hypothetical protein